ncbi:hypothetical protein Y032_0270g879 [Ancylostoma ceylanicum]|uniref:Uncharacterized protein n=1 Tax=Ancylostoma ceylanicum TaxID=53326 RepID=A0A016S8P5_9BILA|nr:hypothetical protein Y032_0270g879 [Ancylostoma ceylanicum]
MNLLFQHFLQKQFHGTLVSEHAIADLGSVELLRLSKTLFQQRMSRFLICLLIFAIVDLSFSGIILTTCARMNVPILQKAAQGACISSCLWQVRHFFDSSQG